MSDLLNISKTIGAIVLGIAWLGLIPFYGAPFVGCSEIAYLTIKLGCSSWPEFLRGFGVILICLLVSPPRVQLHFYVLLILASVTILGGVAALKSGDMPDFHSLRDLLRSILYGAPLFLGGLSAYFSYLGVTRFLKRGVGDN